VNRTDRLYALIVNMTHWSLSGRTHEASGGPPLWSLAPTEGSDFTSPPSWCNLVTGDLDFVRLTMDSNYYGTLAMIRAFAPILARNGGGAILNVLSAAAWNTVDGNTAYAAAKSAQWGLTNGVRVELAGQGTLVSALVPGLIATQTLLDYAASAGIVLAEDAMNDPADLARLALDGLEAGDIEVLDRLGADAKATLNGPPRAFDLALFAAN
jgi:NAD(P)-dependent dehydrogenase (short-subunit alcohol dehydrogenase family)